MYQVDRQGLTLLDTVAVEEDCVYPRVDGHSQQVYIPNYVFSLGVSVVSWEDSRLAPQPTLECVKGCRSVSLMSPHKLCVCDRYSETVNVVSVHSVADDNITATLSKPEEVRDKKPWTTAVLGDSILVRYEGDNLVVYENSVSSPGTMVTWPAELQSVVGMSSDGVSRFLVCDRISNAVFTMDVSRNLCDKINIASRVLDCTVVDGKLGIASTVFDCTVVDGKLWVGCDNGDIVVMSSQ